MLPLKASFNLASGMIVLDRATSPRRCVSPHHPVAVHNQVRYVTLCVYRALYQAGCVTQNLLVAPLLLFLLQMTVQL